MEVSYPLSLAEERWRGRGRKQEGWTGKGTFRIWATSTIPSLTLNLLPVTSVWLNHMTSNTQFSNYFPSSPSSSTQECYSLYLKCPPKSQVLKAWFPVWPIGSGRIFGRWELWVGFNIGNPAPSSLFAPLPLQAVLFCSMLPPWCDVISQAQSDGVNLSRTEKNLWVKINLFSR
jgi:hypothetical protein